MSEAENDIETSYTDNTSTHIVIDTRRTTLIQATQKLTM